MLLSTTKTFDNLYPLNGNHNLELSWYLKHSLYRSSTDQGESPIYYQSQTLVFIHFLETAIAILWQPALKEFRQLEISATGASLKCREGQTLLSGRGFSWIPLQSAECCFPLNFNWSHVIFLQHWWPFSPERHNLHWFRTAKYSVAPTNSNQRVSERQASCHLSDNRGVSVIGCDAAAAIVAI